MAVLRKSYFRANELNALSTVEILNGVGIESDRVASRQAAILCHAAKAALGGWDRSCVDPERIGIYCWLTGTTQDPLLLKVLATDQRPVEESFRANIPPLRFLKRTLNVPTAWVCIQNKIRGPSHTFVHERAGFFHALDQALLDLSSDAVSHALLLGTSASQNDEIENESAVAVLLDQGPLPEEQSLGLSQELSGILHRGEHFEPR